MVQLLQENKWLFGAGLRNQHFKFFTKKFADVDILEIHPENFFGDGIEHYYLEKISKLYKLSFHGVGLSLGSEKRVSKSHLRKIKSLIKRYNPFSYSEHLSWMKADEIYFHDLLPVDYTDGRLNWLVRNIQDTQNYLGQQICIENPSYYINIKGNIPEYEFLCKICKYTKCNILLDINNLYVNSVNHRFDPKFYIDQLDLSLVKEVHLAGHSERNINGTRVIIDTHDNFINNKVWELYNYFVNKSKKIFFTVTEWDESLPKPEELLSETRKAREIVMKHYE